METFTCHECGRPVAEHAVAWLAPTDRCPDEAGGEPFCPACAPPLPIAA